MCVNIYTRAQDMCSVKVITQRAMCWGGDYKAS